MGEREELLAAVHGRVERVRTTKNWSAVLEPAAIAEMTRLQEHITSNPTDHEAACALGWLIHCQSMAIPPEQAEELRKLAVECFRLPFVKGMVNLPPSLLVSIAEEAVPVAVELLEHAGTMESDDLTLIVNAWRRITRCTPDSHPDTADWLVRLAEALVARFEHTGELTDMDEAVELHRAAVEAAPQDRPDLFKYSSLLALCLKDRYTYTRELGDLNEAVEAGRAAVRATDKTAVHIVILADVLQERFDRTGALGDLNEAVKLLRAVMKATPQNSPDYDWVVRNLGSTLRSRYAYTQELGDLNEAVKLLRAAVKAAPQDRLNLVTLAVALQDRAKHTGELTDLNEAVKLFRAAVKATPDTSPHHATVQEMLANTLTDRFEHTGELTDLNEAVKLFRAVMKATPDTSPALALCRNDLGLALHKGFERTEDVAYLHEALSVFEQTVKDETPVPWQRFEAARSVAHLAASSDPGRAADFLERAVLMLPQLAPRRFQRGDQLHALAGTPSELAADAAALALAAPVGDAQERAVRALRLAEAGRAVILSQALETRSDLTDLEDQHPELAMRLSELRDLFDQDQAGAAAPSDAVQAAEIRRARHRLSAQMEEVLERIRACEGFAAFGLPPTTDDLLAEAAHGPVVTFSVSRYGSYAILLTRGGITSCPLPELDADTVVEHANAFIQALGAATEPDGDRIAAQKTLRQTLEWLWDAAAEPVLSALTAMGEAIPPAQDGQPLPRVWWVTGGLLGMLPLHAAGYHTDQGAGTHRRTVLDRVISSYTPTIRALRHARARRSRPAEDSQSLIVAMPTTPDSSPLHHVHEEARRIQALLPRPIQLTEPAPPTDGTLLPASIDTPTTAGVLARLPQCSIAHFACHGASHRTDPSQSQLLLHDHATTPLTVSALAQVDLDRAQLAYLSACSTADLGNPELRDEAIHLTSAFQLAGFPHVVGTLWPIIDSLAVEVAETFYTHLITGPGTLDPDQAATALHHTIRTMRDRYPTTPSLWAAYLHTGA